MIGPGDVVQALKDANIKNTLIYAKIKKLPLNYAKILTLNGKFC
jgi:hypothetical protein